MKKLIFSALLASSTLLILESPVLARNCPPLNKAEITVDDPQGKIRLRTHINTDSQTITDNDGNRVKDTQGNLISAKIDDNETLQVITGIDPKLNTTENICYYPVKLSQANSSTNGGNANVLTFPLYWISETGIKDYTTIASGSPSPSPSPSPPGTDDGGNSQANRVFKPYQKLLWLIISAVILAIIVFLKKDNLRVLFGQFKPNKEESLAQSQSKESQQTNTGASVPRDYSSSYTQELKSPDTLNILTDTLKFLKDQAEQSTSYVEKFDTLLAQQNKLFEQLLKLFEQLLKNSQTDEPLVNKLFEQLLKNGEQMDQLLNRKRRSPEKDVSPANTEGQTEGLKKDLSNQSSYSNVEDPSLRPITEQQQLTSTTVFHQQAQINDPFYKEVISQFNASDDAWFLNRINSLFHKVQVTKNSVLGEIDMGGKITKLELDEQYGTLLVYEAANKCWIIPNPVEPKWKRAAKELFTGDSGKILVRPAEVEALGNDMWQVKEKGEFQA